MKLKVYDAAKILPDMLSTASAGILTWYVSPINRLTVWIVKVLPLIFTEAKEITLPVELFLTVISKYSAAVVMFSLNLIVTGEDNDTFNALPVGVVLIITGGGVGRGGWYPIQLPGNNPSRKSS